MARVIGTTIGRAAKKKPPPRVTKASASIEAAREQPRTRQATASARAPLHTILPPPPGGTSLQRLLPPPKPTKQAKQDRAELHRALKMPPKQRARRYGFDTAEAIRRAELAASIETQPVSPTAVGVRHVGTTAAEASRARREALEAAIDDTGLFDVARTSRARPTGKPRAVLDYAAESLVGHDLRRFTHGEDYSVPGLAADVALLPLMLGGAPIRAGVAAVRGVQATRVPATRGVEAAIRTLAPEERRLLRLAVNNRNTGAELNYAQRSVLDKVFTRTGRITAALRAGYAERPVRDLARWAAGKTPWGNVVGKMMKGIPAGSRIIVDLEDDLVGAHRMSGELVEATKTRLKWVDDDKGPQSVPYGRIIHAGRSDQPAWHGHDLPSKEEALGRIGAPSEAVHATSVEVADDILGTDLAATLPERLRDRDELTAAIDKVYQLAREGVEHRDWYARAGAVAAKVAEAYDIEPRQAAQLMAIFSTGNDPTPNMLHVVQAIEQFESGEKIKSGLYPVEQSKEALQALTTGWSARDALKGEGRKRYSFYTNMLRHIDPAEYQRVLADTGRTGSPVTVDMWVVRMFAPWAKKDVPEGAYDAFEHILISMADKLSWEPEEVQAAAWVAAKARGILGSEIRRGAATGNVRRVPMERAVQRGRDAYETGLSAYVRGYRPGAVEEVRGGVSRLRPIEERPTPASARNVRGRREGAGVPVFTEHPSTRGSIARFRDALRKNPHGWSLADPPPRVLRNSRIFLTPDEQAGYAIGIDGELHSVFRNPAGQRGAGREAVIQAAHRGAYWLNAYEMPGLTQLYEEAGFVPVARIKFDARFAPDDLPEGVEPDVVFMAFGARPYPERTFTDWDDAVRYTRETANPARPTTEPLVRPDFDIAPSVANAVERFREEATSAPLEGVAAFSEQAGRFPERDADRIRDIPIDESMRLSDEEVERLRKAEPFVERLLARLADETGEAEVGLFVPGKSYQQRTRVYNELEQQVPQARGYGLISKATTKTGERFTDWSLNQLEKSRFFRREGLQAMTVGGSVAKYAGRAQRTATDRRLAGAHRALHEVGQLKEGSDADVANFWYAQLPDAYRNASGLQMVRDMQAEHLRYVLSDEYMADIESTRQAIRIHNAELRQQIDELPADALDERGMLIREMFRGINALERYKLIEADRPILVADIGGSLARLDGLIARPPEPNREAIDAVHFLSGAREEILVDAGKLDGGRAENRATLLARALGLEPTGEEAYIGHRLVSPENYPGPPRQVPPGTGKVKPPVGVSRENKLLLARQGRLRPSLRVAAEDWNAAGIFQQANRARDDLARMGERFTGHIPSGSVLINAQGRTIPKHWRSDDMAQFTEGWEDSETIRDQATEIVAGFLADTPAAQAAMQAEVPWEDLRVVPRRLADRYYAQFRSAGRSATGQLVDQAVDAISTSIIFARIGYIPKNIVQNLVMSVPHQGPALLPNIVRAAQLLTDPRLRQLVKSEVGFAGAARALGPSEKKVGKLTGPIKGFVGGTADDLFRTAALVNEMAGEGILQRTKPFLSEADRDKAYKFLSTESPLLNDVSYRANQYMADFNRLTPQQMRWARRLLIIPGWLVAGTRYPFRFAADHPVRSALMAYMAMGEPGAPDELRFNRPLPTYFSGSRWTEGINTPWGRERTGSISPVSTPWEIGRAIAGVGDEAAWDYTNPLVASAVALLRSQVEYPGGAYKAPRSEVARRLLKRLFPGVTFVHDVIQPPEDPYWPGDVTRLGRIERELGVIPIEAPDEGDDSFDAFLKTQDDTSDFDKYLEEQQGGDTEFDKFLKEQGG